MFTGIVETIGSITDISETEEGLRLRIAAPDIARGLAPGQSLSIDGACLTVEEHDSETFTVFLAAETIARTVLAERSVGDVVNIERAMPTDGRFDGHLVQGHIDTTTPILNIERIGEDWRMTFAVPDEFQAHIVEKGSVALDGISLTIAARESNRFSVAIIPATYDGTTLSERGVGDEVHVEIDMIAKYVASMLAERGV